MFEELPAVLMAVPRQSVVLVDRDRLVAVQHLLLTGRSLKDHLDQDTRQLSANLGLVLPEEMCPSLLVLPGIPTRQRLDANHA